MRPLLVSVVGRSGVGKTHLIQQLLPELIRRRFRVGTAKDCPHGFELDRPGKDSWKFSRSGSIGVLLTSPTRLGLVRPMLQSDGSVFLALMHQFFWDFDMVLLEGFAQVTETTKLELLRKGISECPDPELCNVMARVSDIPVGGDVPVISADAVRDIADFLEGGLAEAEQHPRIGVTVNGEFVRLNSFVQELFANVVLSLVETLRRPRPEEPARAVTITMGNHRHA